MRVVPQLCGVEHPAVLGLSAIQHAELRRTSEAPATSIRASFVTEVNARLPHRSDMPDPKAA